MRATWINSDQRFAFSPSEGDIDISDADHAALIDAQSRGAQIERGDDGYPVAVDPSTPTPTALSVKSEAARRLASTDWYAIRRADTGEDIPAEIVAYRAAVRTRSGEIEVLDPIPIDYATDEWWPNLPPETPV